jgi:hypothetical protein
VAARRSAATCAAEDVPATSRPAGCGMRIGIAARGGAEARAEKAQRDEGRGVASAAAARHRAPPLTAGARRRGTNLLWRFPIPVPTPCASRVRPPPPP